MSAAASSSNPVKASTEGAQEPIKDANAPPTLGVLEEDDEFEEFPVQGVFAPSHTLRKRLCRPVHAQTGTIREQMPRTWPAPHLARRRAAGTSSGKTTGMTTTSRMTSTCSSGACVWTLRILLGTNLYICRAELAKTGKGSGGSDAMQT
jgi:hypothetical protein